MKSAILRYLKKRPAWVSGEEICQVFNLSRTAVWKHINALRRDGYTIEARPRKGYRLVSPPDLLLPEEITEGLHTRIIGYPYLYYPVLDSTNNQAKQLAQDGAGEGTVVLAEEQTGGRGRMGRRWHSPRGGLWFSIILRPPFEPARAAGATFVAAVACVKAIRSYMDVGVGIKWPNDLVYRGRKMGGILTELSAEMDRINFLVVGIGLNINNSTDILPPGLRANVITLRQIAGREVSRKEILQAVLQEFEEWYLRWCREGLGPVLETWKFYNTCIGSEIYVKGPGGEWHGRALDVDEEGALLLQTGSGEVKRILSGDVALVGKE
ncbi:MAG: biotin--[acetyl-CoA-carboxylase] ligase [Peptococcaceae bacterium]|nr:biotin--[acetyl-CoA-carboxylase] ligase [Peptococcaceae bacterium]